MPEELPPVPQDSDFSPQTKASLVHLGQMMGTGRDEFDEEVAKRLEEHEANYKKMRAAEQGELGPGEFEQKEIEQTQALGQQATIQGAQKAQAAQAGQAPQQAPTEAPGPQGQSAPYPAQDKDDQQ